MPERDPLPRRLKEACLLFLGVLFGRVRVVYRARHVAVVEEGEPPAPPAAPLPPEAKLLLEPAPEPEAPASVGRYEIRVHKPSGGFSVRLRTDNARVALADFARPARKGCVVEFFDTSLGFERGRRSY